MEYNCVRLTSKFKIHRASHVTKLFKYVFHMQHTEPRSVVTLESVTAILVCQRETEERDFGTAVRALL